MSKVLVGIAAALLGIAYMRAMHDLAFIREVGAAPGASAQVWLDFLWPAAVFVVKAASYVVVVLALVYIGFHLYFYVKRKMRRGGPYYFSTFGIILVPMNLSEPISEVEAREREEKGIVYYIGYFDDSGNLLTAQKRRNHKTDYSYNYLYDKGRVTEYIYTRADLSRVQRRTATGEWVRIR